MAEQEEEPKVAQEEQEMVDETTESASEHAEEEKDPIGAQMAELKDKYLRLYADFDNYKKRTARERLDLIQTSTKDLIQILLPVLDDFDRAIKAAGEAEDAESVKEGMSLIHHKLYTLLQQKGLKPMDSIEKEFDADLHEAITEIPAPNEDLKGKVVDVVEKGYLLNEHIIRYAKVVVGK